MARRMGILLGVWLSPCTVHLVGDVLFTYALMGFIMIAVIRIPKKWLLPIAAIVYIVTSGIIVWYYLLLEQLDPNQLMEGYVDIHQIELALGHMRTDVMAKFLAFRLQSGYSTV